jgi:hypothetical protein
MQRITETREMPRDVDTIPFCRLYGATSIRPPTDVSSKESSETMRPLVYASLYDPFPYWGAGVWCGCC